MTIDPAAEANALADRFNDLSQAVDEFRLGFEPPLRNEQMSQLKDVSQALEDCAHHYTAVAIGATLQAIQPDLEKIKLVTEQAAAQLAKLNNIERGITLATLALSLGTAIAAHDPATIIAAVQAFSHGLIGTPAATSTASTSAAFTVAASTAVASAASSASSSKT